jgi:hypothetical protein
MVDIYLPYAQAPSPTVELIVHASILRTDSSDRCVRERGDRRVSAGRADRDVTRARDSLKGARFYLVLIGSFAVVAILLACVGIYGAMACAVQSAARVRRPPGARRRRPRSCAERSGNRRGSASPPARSASPSAHHRAADRQRAVSAKGVHNGLLHGVTTTDPVALAARRARWS